MSSARLKNLFGHVLGQIGRKREYGNWFILNTPVLTKALFGTTPVRCDSVEKNAAVNPMPTKPRQKAEKISKAMKAYLEKAQAHDKFMLEQVADYELGKRHLANIMGEDPDSFTQDDINAAISYLMPSGLHNKKARPSVKHPSEVYPPRKAAQFGSDGRPFHFLFYTGFPNYYQLMHDISYKLEKLKQKEDEMLRHGVMPAEVERTIALHGSEWQSLTWLNEQLLETVNEHFHRRFVLLMDRLCGHSLAYTEEEFIMKYRFIKPVQSFIKEAITPLVDEKGREYVEAAGQRKTSLATVRIYAKGSGRIVVNGVEPLYMVFDNPFDREHIMYPLQFINKIFDFDIEASVKQGGQTGKAGAIRLALSRALCSFLDRDTVERMRLAGLLTFDPRRRERKKPGQKGARKKFTWKKR